MSVSKDDCWMIGTQLGISALPTVKFQVVATTISKLLHVLGRDHRYDA